MDASEVDQDIELRKAAQGLLDELRQSLLPFIWKKTRSGEEQLRERVRTRDTERIVQLLEPFQEDPQLLDPHLAEIIPLLADAFLEYLRHPPSNSSATNPHLLMPLSKALCKLLYTFCKIRGEKVIVRFWSTDLRHLELLLSAIEEDQEDETDVEIQVDDPGSIPRSVSQNVWGWEERYIVLLWLSQLFLAPFDLATMSSGVDDLEEPSIPGFSWPRFTPGVTIRVIPLAIRYLSSSGKERDAAKVLLVRVAMRRDMEELGILRALVHWSLFCLLPSSPSSQSTYHYIGILSFVAGMLVASQGTTEMDPYLPLISQAVQDISAASNPLFHIQSSAVARKIVIKILRSVVVLLLRKPESDVDPEIIENTIAHLLESLADPATPVRLSSGKALSLIILKLPPHNSLQVVDAILEMLSLNVFWVPKPHPVTAARDSNKDKIRDLSRVNPLEWHGLMFTLSNLLYRRSVPKSNLSPILNALRLGLSFEQKSTSGSSIGTNVRDAACYGIWSLARKYTTEELQSVGIEFDVATQSIPQDPPSALQILATDLVVSASLDPAGNIRRGASAALQELVGRHPDTIAEGIQTVQVVDYHAVALRSRAVQDVAFKTAQLSDYYYSGLSNALLGWRGIQQPDADARRVAAAAFGKLVWEKTIHNDSWPIFDGALDVIGNLLRRLSAREAEDRHGLISSLAVMLSLFNEECTNPKVRQAFNSGIGPKITPHGRSIFSVVRNITSLLRWVLADVDQHLLEFRSPELIAEATSRLLTVAYSVLRADSIFCSLDSGENPSGIKAANSVVLNDISLAASRVDFDAMEALHTMNDIIYSSGTHPDEVIIRHSKNLVEKFLKMNDRVAADTVSDAAADFLLIADRESLSRLVLDWIYAARTTVKGGRTDQGATYMHTLFKIFPISSDGFSERQFQSEIIQTIHIRWSTFHEIETRCTILRCLAKSTVIHTHTAEFIDIIAEGLDDYTTNARGDVGSLVRIEAAKASSAIWNGIDVTSDSKKEAFSRLIGRVIRIAAEKLDRVRVEGKQALSYALCASSRSIFQELSTSSRSYFSFLLTLKHTDFVTSGPDLKEWRTDLLEGYISSADTGSEDLVRASRAALVSYCEAGNSQAIAENLVEVLKRNIENDRVLVPALETMGFLFDMRILLNLDLKWQALYALTQKAHYKTSNVRKLEAAIKVYGGLMEVFPDAVTKLTALLLHPYPKIREKTAEELWGKLAGSIDSSTTSGIGLKGVNWGKSKKGDVDKLREELARTGVPSLLAA